MDQIGGVTQIPTSWSEFRNSQNPKSTIDAVAKERFTLGSETIKNLNSLISSYRTDNTFTTRCWHVIKGVFGAGDEWNSIQSLEEARNRLLSESLIAKLGGFNTQNALNNTIRQFLSVDCVLLSKNEQQQVLDRALFHCVSSKGNEMYSEEILKALLEKGANPDQFHPLEDAIPGYQLAQKDKNEYSGKLSVVTGATAFGMYVVSGKVTREGVAAFLQRTTGSKGYIGEPRVTTAPRLFDKMLLVLPTSWIATPSTGQGRTIDSVKAFLTQGQQEALGLQDQEKAI